MPDWDALPRLLQELCDGHPAYVTEAYALDLPNRTRQWLCKSCWIRAWTAAGRPEVPTGWTDLEDSETP